ncbi:hypothetical protein PG988_009161 [Apiospora saccharicola]
MSSNHAPVIKKLHEQYGPVVRTGPNMLDLNIPSLIRTVYNTNGQWLKSNFYKVNSTFVDGKILYNLFSELNTGKARQTQEADCATLLEFKRLGYRAADGRDTWDFMSAVTFSKQFGYMEKGYDFDGSQEIGDRAMDYLGIVGNTPWLDHWLDKNPIVHIGPPNLAHATHIAAESLFARLKGEDTAFNPQHPDFLQYFIDSQTSHPEVVDNATTIGYLLLNLLAGADTTGITLKALFYYCMRSPQAWTRLNEDVLAAGIDPAEVPSYSVARSIRYLDAVVHEALRIHPPASMTLERMVPECGLTLPDGSVVPGGTTVGMNPYVINRNKEIFGPDADEFNPDRWLQQAGETDAEYQERMRLWNASDLSFGGWLQDLPRPTPEPDGAVQGGGNPDHAVRD